MPTNKQLKISLNFLKFHTLKENRLLIKTLLASKLRIRAAFAWCLFPELRSSRKARPRAAVPAVPAGWVLVRPAPGRARSAVWGLGAGSVLCSLSSLCRAGSHRH